VLTLISAERAGFSPVRTRLVAYGDAYRRGSLERMKISWVTLDRFCQDEAQVNEEINRTIECNGRPLRSTAEPLSDDELLAKLGVLAGAGRSSRNPAAPPRPAPDRAAAQRSTHRDALPSWLS